MARKKKQSRAIVEEFEAYFGTGTLQDWQRLCRDVGLSGDLPSITQCRKVILPLVALPNNPRLYLFFLAKEGPAGLVEGRA